MGIRDVLDDVLNLYALAKEDDFKGNTVAEILRYDFPNEVRFTIEAGMPNVGVEYQVEGSSGKGQWNRCPWVAVFNPIVTTSAQRGYYPVYLFREDMCGVYLSLNQGVTDIREQYKSTRKDALKARAADYRSRLGSAAKQFPVWKIDLKPSSRQSYSADYEAGNIVAKYYPADNLPEEESLCADLLQLLALYERLLYSVGSDDGTGIEPEEQDNEFIEDYAAFRYHRRIERSQKLAKAVKKAHGYTCEACGFSFAKVYRGIRKNKYIEAHHLVPVASLKDQKVSLDPVKDFAVLCANCHRMIHRFHSPGDVMAFREAIESPLIKRIVGKRLPYIADHRQ